MDILRSDYISVIDNYVYGNYYGLNIGKVTHMHISGNHIEENQRQGIRQYDNTATGPVTIHNNRIENNGSHGIDCSVTTYARGNYIQGNTNEGVRLSGGNSWVIAGNTILDNTDNGILVFGSNHEVRDNFFTNTGSAQARALFENASQGPTYMVNNRILNQSNTPYTFSNSASRYSDENTLESATVTSAYTTTKNDNIILCNQSAVITITLISAITAGQGHVYTIKDKSGNASTNTITIATSSAQTIDGASTKTVNTNYGLLKVISDGSNWFTI